MQENHIKKLANVTRVTYLCSVFHGIRFKVNKGFGTQRSPFLCPYVWNHKSKATFPADNQYIIQQYTTPDKHRYSAVSSTHNGVFTASYRHIQSQLC